MRTIKDIAEDLVKTGLTIEQQELLDELLAATAGGDTENAVPEGDDPNGSD